MEEGFGSKGTTNVPHQVHSFVNVADDDRTEEVDFAYALQQYHKASTEKLCSVVQDAQNYCYYLLDSMPKPEPTWSTTTTSCVLVEPTPNLPSSLSQTPQIEGTLGVLEFGEKNQEGSSYSWWMGFLDGLDCNIMNNEEILLDHPFVEKNDNESQFVDSMDLSCCFCPDDWLMVPTMEKDFGDIVMP